jgi:DNA-directed RNA polymerase alpha subunit
MRAGINTVNQLRKMLIEDYAKFGTPQTLLKVRNLGQKSANEILSTLQKLGLEKTMHI